MRRIRETIAGILFLSVVSVMLVRVNHERRQLSSFTFGIQNQVLGSQFGSNTAIMNTTTDIKSALYGTVGKVDTSNTPKKVTFVVQVAGELGNHVSSTHAEALAGRFCYSSC
jgi:hypothetical protein